MHDRARTATDIIRAVKNEIDLDLPVDDVLVSAARGVFGDAQVRPLLSHREVQSFAILALTSWSIADWDDDELFAGEGLSAGDAAFDYSTDHGLSKHIVDVISKNSCRLYHDASQPAEVRSLAFHVARHQTSREVPDTYDVISESLHRKRAPRPVDARPPLPDNGWFKTEVQFIMDSALEPSWRRHFLYDDAPGTIIYLNYPGPATVLYAEFGYRSIVGAPYQARVQEILEELYPRVESSLLHAIPRHPAPIGNLPFTPDEDWFFRQITIGRLSKLSLPRSRGGSPSYSYPEALVPFAEAVVARASTDETRAAGIQLLTKSREQLRKSNEAWFARTYPARSEAQREGRYQRQLAGFALPLTLILGALAGSLSAIVPDWISSLPVVLGAFAPLPAIAASRRRAGYIDSRYPVFRSLVASLLLGLGYILFFGLAYVLLDRPGSDLLWFWLISLSSSAVWVVAYFFAVRYGLRFRVRPSSLVPELPGLPWEIDDAAREALDDQLSRLSKR